MARTVGIGHQNFEQIIQNNIFYIDKTKFIKEWWERGDVVTLITRPRRFGKTLTMSMTEQENETFRRKSIDMNDTEATLALNQLSEYLYRYYGKKVIILLDEYDTPMQEAYVNGYWEQLVYDQRSGKRGAVWSFLLAGGYLKVVSTEFVEQTGTLYYKLALTNKEVRIMFVNMIRDRFDSDGSDHYNDFIKALLMEESCKRLQRKH